MSTLTTEQTQSIAKFLENRHISSGVGTHEEACSIASVNLALTGVLTDEIPQCMSRVIGKWIIIIQDAMPDEMRNSADWRSLLPLAAGTGRERETERAAIVLDWMWDTLTLLQPVAENLGFGNEWREMCESKSKTAVDAARAAADAASDATFWQSANPIGMLEKLIKIR